MRQLLLVLLFFAFTSSLAQEWQSLYNASVDAFKARQYQESLAKAEEALERCKATDTKQRAYAIQLITAASLEVEKGEKGLSYSDQEIQLFASLEPKTKNHCEAIRKKAQLLLLSGKPDGAAKTYRELWSLQGEVSGKNSYECLTAMAAEGDSWLQAKRYEDARASYSQCLSGLRALPDAGEDYLYTLYNAAFADFQMKDFNSSSIRLGEFIKLVESNGLQAELPEYAQARKMLSSINSAAANGGSGFLLAEDEIKKLLQSALSAQVSNINDAKSKFAQCEKLVNENNFVNNTAFSLYLNYGRFLFSVDDFVSADQKLQQAKAQAMELFKQGCAETAHLDVLEGDLLLNKGKAVDAAALYKRSIPFFIAEDKNIAEKQVRWIGEQLLLAGRAEEALQCLAQLINHPAFSTLRPLQKIALEKLNAHAHFDSRQAELLKTLLKEKTSRESDPLMKQAYLLLSAQTEKELGNWNVALDLLQEGKKIQTEEILVGDIYFEIARLQQQLGNLKDAEIAYGRAVETVAASMSAQTLTPQVYNSFATFYIQLGNYETAEKLFTTLLQKEEANSPFYNAVKQNFASMYLQTGRFKEAKSLLLKTLESDRILVGDNHPDYGVALQNLAAVYQKVGNLDSAMLLYEKALAIDKNHYGENSQAYATKLANLAAVYQEMSNFQKSRDVFMQALAIRKKVLPPDHPDYAYNLYNLGFLFYRTHEPQKALPYFQEAAAYYLKQIKDVFPVLSDFERTAFFNKIQEVVHGYEMFMVEHFSLNPSLPGELFNFRLETKALLLSASIKVRNQILQSGNQELIGKFAVWQHTKEQLAYLYSLSLHERQQHIKLIEEYKTKSNELEKWLSLQSESFASSFNLISIDWKKIEAVLSPGEAAVEILRVKLPQDSLVYAALILKPGTTLPQMIVIENGKQLEERGFRGYINAIQFQMDDANSFETFWAKIDAALPGVSKIYLSTDGIYNKINPATLYNSKTSQYVLDKLQIQLTSNLKDLLSKSGQPITANRSALLMGFPDYRLDAQAKVSEVQAGTRSLNLFYDVLKGGVSDLPGTEKEVSQIRQSLESSQWKTELYMREHASEEKIKAARSHAVLHIATHGFFVTPAKTTGRQVFGNDITNVENNAMLRSGLLLAGAEKHLISRLNGQLSKGVDDGILTSFEVMNLNLDHTNLVVLSACETAKGDVRNGEGVYGLQRAFMLAGAKSIIMSLWKVDDNATQELMSTFYNAWLSGNDRAHAFYKTQLEVRKKFPHPYYWGAFVVTGNL